MRPRTSRFVPALLTLLVAFPACAARSAGPTSTVPLDQLNPDDAFEVAAARGSVIAFLDAYAASGQGGARALTGLAGSPELLRWAQWWGIEVAGFPGTVKGTADVKSIAFAGFTSLPDQPVVASLVVDATVSFVITPHSGSPVTQAYAFNGPASVFQRGPGSWAVLDITRDGASLSQGIRLFRNKPERQGDVSVTLDSLFTFGRWGFNVIVMNLGKDPIRFDPKATALEAGSGSSGLRPRQASPALATVAPRTDARGTVVFAPPAGTSGGTLSLVYSRGREQLTFAFDLTKLLIRATAGGGTGGSPAVGSPTP